MLRHSVICRSAESPRIPPDRRAWAWYRGPWLGAVVLWLLMPGLLVVPPPIGPIVVLVDELLLRGVLLVVPTLPVGLAPPELIVLWAEVPVWACTGMQRRAVPATRAAIMTIREIIASPLSLDCPRGDNA